MNAFIFLSAIDVGGEASNGGERFILSKSEKERM